MSASIDDIVAVRSANWEGSIPVVLSLSSQSLSAPSMPAPIHVLLSRHTFLHLGLQFAVRRLFQFALISLPSSKNTIIRSEPAPGETSEETNNLSTGDEDKPETYPVCWFEDEEAGTALRWHLFVGVLWDMKRKQEKQLPWRIRLHFTSYPSSQILPFDDDLVLATVERTFKNSLKQALVSQYGSNKVALNISKQSHERLWDSIEDSKYKLYQQVNDDLQMNNICDMNLLPVRLLVDTRPPIQRACPVKESESTTLGDLLADWIPELFQKDVVEETDVPSRVCCFVQGLEISLSMELVELWRSLCHPDHFLYIVITTR